MLLEKCGLDDSITVRPVVGIDGGAKKRGSWDDFFQGIDGGIIWFKSSRFWQLFGIACHCLVDGITVILLDFFLEFGMPSQNGTMIVAICGGMGW